MTPIEFATSPTLSAGYSQRPPTSSLVPVAGLVLPDLLLEVEAVACGLA